MTRYLLDSNVLIDWLQGRSAAVELLERLASARHVLAANDLTIGETYAGMSDEEALAADGVLRELEYWPIPFSVAARAGRYRYSYRKQGRTYAIVDTLIAAHAMEADATLVTGNVKDFPMPELRILHYRR